MSCNCFFYLFCRGFWCFIWLSSWYWYRLFNCRLFWLFNNFSKWRFHLSKALNYALKSFKYTWWKEQEQKSMGGNLQTLLETQFLSDCRFENLQTLPKLKQLGILQILYHRWIDYFETTTPENISRARLSVNSLCCSQSINYSGK